ncbi:hypothetical protein FHG87_000146 [Trinorchestia longiramus]|nr:hypothetical protein FHG87_000146 [Trinorchestia longiramus]
MSCLPRCRLGQALSAYSYQRGVPSHLEECINLDLAAQQRRASHSVEWHDLSETNHSVMATGDVALGNNLIQSSSGSNISLSPNSVTPKNATNYLVNSKHLSNSCSNSSNSGSSSSSSSSSNSSIACSSNRSSICSTVGCSIQYQPQFQQAHFQSQFVQQSVIVSPPIPEFRDVNYYWMDQTRHIIRPKPRSIAAIVTRHQLGRLVSESACEREDPGSNPAADMVDAAKNTAWDLAARPHKERRARGGSGAYDQRTCEASLATVWHLCTTTADSCVPVRQALLPCGTCALPLLTAVYL